jgi:GH15 family glucan-1,4-alpha-glucosidase
MAAIEDYALIGDTRTVALVGRDGSIDWWCAPRFDSAACFAAMLGDTDHGRWLLGPVDAPTETSRAYLDDTLVLVTTVTTSTGRAEVVDFMPRHDLDHPCIIRLVRGLEGRVEFRSETIVRFDYGCLVPWVRRHDGGIEARGGADGVVLHASVPLRGRHMTTQARFAVEAGRTESFVAAWFPSHEDPPMLPEPEVALAETEAWWRVWARTCADEGPWSAAVRRSLVTLKALTFEPTGGIVAAPTTSLPEWIGSVRNWDYRYCWLRDATFTLTALVVNGYHEEALAWSEWLRRAVAGSPEELQIMYGVAGERRLTEYEIGWLPGYEGSAPVRVGNGASEQFQLDVYGEVLDMMLTTASALDRPLPADVWALCRMLVDHVGEVWDRPDDGIWEVRGPRRHFVHSKVMAWVAVDRWIMLCEQGRPREPLDGWRELRDRIHTEICARGWNDEVGSFTQHYGSDQLDASLLMLALVGFLPPDDPRIVATVEAVERELLVDGFVLRYRTDVVHPPPPADGSVDAVADALPGTVDGLPPGEGAFLLTTFWLVDNLVLIGRVDDARVLFERLLDLRNDVGLLAEEFDPATGRMLGNFPQAFSHVGLVNSAANLEQGLLGPAARRGAHDRRR